MEVLAVLAMVIASASTGPGERIVSERRLQRLTRDLRVLEHERAGLGARLDSTRRLSERRRERLAALSKATKRRPARRQDRRRSR